ncbi:MAG: hypothetical protein OFPII_06190 [Osedax symbiont Rs1]|nr:MAG: hypothetical protein OFPII_06190 [Osedax symbiont Rs1]
MNKDKFGKKLSDQQLNPAVALVTPAAYTTACPACQQLQLVNPKNFTLAAGKLWCVRCRCMFDAKKHRLTKSSTLENTDSINANKVAATKSTTLKPVAKKRRLNYLYTVLIVFSILLTVLQLAYFNRDQWSQINWMKPAYNQVYLWLGYAPKKPLNQPHIFPADN